MTHLKCSQCGLNNSDDATVCERCGVALGSEPVTTPPAPPDFPDLFTFGTEPPKHSRKLKVILAVVITLAVGGGGWALYMKSANSSRGREAKRRQLVERTADERKRRQIRGYDDLVTIGE